MKGMCLKGYWKVFDCSGKNLEQNRSIDDVLDGSSSILVINALKVPPIPQAPILKKQLTILKSQFAVNFDLLQKLFFLSSCIKKVAEIEFNQRVPWHVSLDFLAISCHVELWIHICWKMKIKLKLNRRENVS